MRNPRNSKPPLLVNMLEGRDSVEDQWWDETQLQSVRGVTSLPVQIPSACFGDLGALVNVVSPQAIQECFRSGGMWDANATKQSKECALLLRQSV